MNTVFFQLYANCILVKGYKRYSICDLQIGKIFFLPLKIGNKFNNEFNYVGYCKIDEDFKLWIKKLESNDLGCFTENPSSFPRLSMEYKSPEVIKYAILEFDYLNLKYIKKVIDNLNYFNTKFIEIRFYDFVKISKLKHILSLIKEGSYKGITIYTKFNNDTMEDLKKIVTDNGIIRQLIIHSSPYEDLNNQHRIGYTSKKIESNIHCGNIQTDYFSINIKVFSESKSFNSCLNQKISIDVNGNIKNCPSMTQSFGSIKETNLQEALEHPDFKKHWNTTKDQIDVCKDCEFRYVCTDCRAYIENPEDQYSKPLKCGYDPYTNEWKEWSKNPLKQKTIEYYGMQELVKKND